MIQFEEAIGDRPVRLAVSQISARPFPLRLEPPNLGHVETLAQLNGTWPPLLVLAADRSIIDGQHRFMAAKLLRLSSVDCYLFHGSAETAFLEALRLNSHQGLALTLKEREAAACRVLELHQDWSDRRVGALCGLSPTTVGRLRLAMEPCPDVHSDQMDVRVGRDQRARPVDIQAMRRRVTEELRARPYASLREIASVAHCSPETVRSVRKSLVEEGWRTPAPPSEFGDEPPRTLPREPGDMDNAFMSTLEGAAFTRWFETTHVDPDECQRHVTDVPLSRVYEIADAALVRSTAWREFARSLEARVRATRP